MARSKGSANFSGSLEVLAGAPLDARLVVSTKTDLTNSGSYPYKYIGMVVSVQDEQSIYMLVGNDSTNISNWKELGKQGEEIQKTSLPLAGSTEEGNIYQYIGATGNELTHGYFYECVEDDGVYQWEAISVQEGSGASLPAGGTTGQALVKKSNADQDVEWSDVGGGGGTYTGGNGINIDANNEITTDNMGSVDMSEVVTPLPGISSRNINYSTTEQRIGSWIDGGPLYQKTFYLGNLPNATTTTYNFVNPDISKIINIQGVAISETEQAFLNLPHASLSGSTVMIYATINSNGLNIIIGSTIDRSTYVGYVTLQYTKTTD